MRRGLLRSASAAGVAGLALSALAAAAAQPAVAGATGAAATTTPVKHVIVIIGENHSFGNLFATYQPPRGQQIDNLLSEGIVTANGSPGRRAQLAAADACQLQRGQPAQPGPGRVRAPQPAGHREPDDHVRLRPS
jgi:phospholipase C